MLVVDDDVLVREAVAALLTSHGYAVRTAADAGEAGRVAATGEPRALALVDYRLPDGQTALEAVRAVQAALGAGRRVPVIVVTGDTHPQRIRDAQSLGYPVLFKPLPAEVLLGAVSEALRRSA